MGQLTKGNQSKAFKKKKKTKLQTSGHSVKILITIITI